MVAPLLFAQKKKCNAASQLTCQPQTQKKEKEKMAMGAAYFEMFKSSRFMSPSYVCCGLSGQ
jgi:hypothetical protein